MSEAGKSQEQLNSLASPNLEVVCKGYILIFDYMC